MSVLLYMVGAVMFGYGVMVLARDLSRRKHHSSRRRKRPTTLWENRWLAISCVLLGLALVVLGIVTGTAPGSTTSRTDRTRSADDPAVTQPMDGSDEESRQSEGSDATGSLAPDTAEAAAPGLATAAQGAARGEAPATNVYRSAVIDVSNRISQELGRLTGQLVNAQYGDAEWVTETKAVCAAMEAAADEAREITPSSGYEAAHAAWMEGIDSFDWAAENLATAIEGPDFALLRQCTDRMTSASASFNRSMVMMQEIDGLQ